MKKNVNFVYFLCLINWESLLESEEVNQIKDYISRKAVSNSPEPFGDWIKIDLGWEKKIGIITESKLGFYHSRLIFKFGLQEVPKTITEIREIREELEKEIIDFCGDEEKKFIKQIKDRCKTPYIFIYQIFEIEEKAELWKAPEQRPYSLQTTCFFTDLYDPREKCQKGRYVKMRISGAKLIATNMGKWFFQTLVNIIFHEGLYRQTRDEKFMKRNKNKLIYRGLENRLEDFAKSLMTIFHQYSSDYWSRRIKKIALWASIIIPIIILILSFLFSKIL